MGNYTPEEKRDKKRGSNWVIVWLCCCALTAVVLWLSCPATKVTKKQTRTVERVDTVVVAGDTVYDTVYVDVKPPKDDDDDDDKDKGHGNEDDDCDEQNPGKSKPDCERDDDNGDDDDNDGD